MPFTPPPSAPAATPVSPSRSTDNVTFSNAVDAFLAWISTFTTWLIGFVGWAVTWQGELTSAQSDVSAKQLAAAASAASASASATAAAVAANCPMWVSGTTYAIGDCRFSPADFQTYRRRTVGAGTTDPLTDTTNWALLLTQRAWITKTGAYTVTSGDRVKADTQSIGAFSITFPIAPIEGDQIEILDVKSSFDINNLTLLGNGKTIMGVTNLFLNVKYLHRVFTYDAILNDWRI